MEPLPADLINRLDLLGAIEAEIAGPPGMLPSRIMESVMVSHSTELAERLRGELGGRVQITQGELVWASKARLHARPIHTLPFRDRCIYRALVQDVAGAAPTAKAQAAANAAFKTGVLVGGVRWVAQADVAAFFQFIDHEALTDEVILHTAKSDSARNLRTVLFELVGRGFGLPQNLWSSRLLAEFYLQPVESELTQLGFTVTRFSDDFRIGARTVSEAFKGIEQLQNLLHERGLTLNEGKSRVSSRASYARSVDRLSRRIDAALEALEVDPDLFDPYSDNSIAAGDEDFEAPGTTLFSEALKHLLVAKLDPFDRIYYRQLLLLGLNLLGMADSPAAIDEGPRLMTMDPSLTPPFARYLRGIGPAVGAETVVRGLDAVARSVAAYAPDWQAAWLMTPLLDRTVKPTTRLGNWARRLWEGTGPSVLRSRGALVLSLHGALSPDHLASAFKYAANVSKPEIITAMAIGANGEGPSGPVESVLEADPTNRWIYDYAVQNSQDLGWV